MSNRLIEIETQDVFGADAIATSFSGREEISRTYEYVLTVSSRNTKLKPADVIGKPFCISINRNDLQGNEKPCRYFHGFVSHFGSTGPSDPNDPKQSQWKNYRIRVVPSIWFMTQSARCFVYFPEKAKKSIKDVLTELLDRVADYAQIQNKYKLTNAKILSREVDHCIQYRESDFNFLSRNLEQLGAFYYFLHDKSSHECIFSDMPTYPECIEKNVELRTTNSGQNSSESISSWEHAFEFVPGIYAHGDFNYGTPSDQLQSMEMRHPTIKLQNNATCEVYDHPGQFDDREQSSHDANRRLEAEEVRYDTILGNSTCKTFQAGHTFALKENVHAPEDKGKSFLLVSVHHMASQSGPFSGDTASVSYYNQFTCIPQDRQFRPRRLTANPIVPGVQTAIVVGPPGEEIHTDPEGLGRVKVMFHWDRENRGGMNENHSCWVRVSQIHAGKGFGGIDIPRVGEEVIVSFIEGDLDRPIITGRVYNAEAMPPFKLPGEKTRSGLKTKTYKGDGYNELSMDDTPGNEQIRIHGQYNMDTVVEHDETHTIHNNRTKQVDVDEDMTIGNNQTLQVGVDRSVTVGNNQNVAIGSNQTTTVGQDLSLAVGMNQTEVTALTKSETVGVSNSLTVGASNSINVGGMMSTSVGGSKSVSVGQSLSVTVSKDESRKIGKKITIEAGDQITLKTGKASITMKKDGTIQISGKDITIQGSGKITAKATKDMVLKGKKILQN